jgi:hypothetical protein
MRAVDDAAGIAFVGPRFKNHCRRQPLQRQEQRNRDGGRGETGQDGCEPGAVFEEPPLDRKKICKRWRYQCECKKREDKVAASDGRPWASAGAGSVMKYIAAAMGAE